MYGPSIRRDLLGHTEATVMRFLIPSLFLIFSFFITFFSLILFYLGVAGAEGGREGTGNEWYQDT